MAARARRRAASRRERRLSVAEAQFYARVYGSARKGSLAELRRRGCTEQEAEETFADAFAQVMESVDPIAREFSAAQMVSFVKRTCWRCMIDERRRGELRGELEASGLGARPEAGAETPGELAEEREAVAVGREALATLSERDRAVFRRRHLLGMTPEEVVRETPGLSMRNYRLIVQRANARVLEAFARIEAGERCAEMEGELLRRYLAGEGSREERRAVEAHLAHCRACQRAGARMRGYLIDVAGGALLASSLGGGSAAAGSLPARLLELASQGAQALGGGSRAARERLREVLLRASGALPGSGTDAGAAQALGASSWRIVSACTAGVAAGACVAAGVVPGIGGIGLSDHHRHHRTAVPARQARAASAPRGAGTSEYAAPVPAATGSGETGASASANRSGARKGGARTPTASRERPTAAPRASGSQVGTEFGPEAGQPTPSSGASPPPPSSSQGASVSGASAAKGSGSGSGGGSRSTAKSSPEFGF
jgi:RNA polymerase sigma factor (sigma-70 family)